MDPEAWRKIERLFEGALELAPGERDAFLQRECGGDAELKKEIEALLAAYGDAGDFLEQPVTDHGIPLAPTGGSAGSLTGAPPPGPSRERIGPYQLIRKIGEGGMSEVYLAVRADDEYRKSVALKIIRHGQDREDLLRRFRTERQILAGLDHPNIARLLDGGTTEDGLPYFVMDHIDGIPIDEHCDRNRLSVRERLELFRSVCAAVQYAHQSLVVHRDIKTSNILVGADGVPKLLDFGIAKLLKPDQFAEQAEYTATWMRPMTPRYASPEQVQGKLVGTPSDVYSLGVLLYKLLTGHLPYHLEGQPPSELARLVVEEVPEKPSSAVDREETVPGVADRVTPVEVARSRNTQPPQLRRRLSGDLDNILLMALRKEPQRRYGSVEQFSEDIRRHLDGLPVAARRDTVAYRTAKFFRRNRLAVAAGAAFVLLLVGFSITMTVQASRIAHERDQARRDRDRAERVIDLLEGIFEISDPNSPSGENITAREILDQGADKVAGELGDQPEVQATLMGAIGNVYRNLGLYERAESLLGDALETQVAVHGDRHPDVARIHNDLGFVLRLKGDYKEAETHLREALEIRRSLLGDDDPAVAESLNRLGVLLRQTGEYEEAEGLYREAIEIQERTLGDSVELADGKNNLAALLTHTGNLGDAEPLFREALEIRRRLQGPRHMQLAQCLGNLGACLGIQGKYDEAEAPLREALEMYRELVDDDHPVLAQSLNNLGKLYQRKGDLVTAGRYIREAVDIQRRRLGDDHPELALMTSNLAELLEAQGELDEAESIYRDALRIRRRGLGERHPAVGSSLLRLGSLLVARGTPGPAEPLLREGLDIVRESLPRTHWRIPDAQSRLGECLGALRRFEEAESLLVSGYEGLRNTRGPEHTLSRAARGRLADFYERSSRPDEASRYRSD